MEGNVKTVGSFGLTIPSKSRAAFFLEAVSSGYGSKLTNFCAHNAKYHTSQKQKNLEIHVADVDGWVDDIGGDIEDGAPIAGAEAGEMVRIVGELVGLKTQVRGLTSGLKDIYKLVKKLGAGMCPGCAYKETEMAPVEEVTTAAKKTAPPNTAPAVAAALCEESDSEPEPPTKKQKKKAMAKKVAVRVGSTRRASGRLDE